MPLKRTHFKKSIMDYFQNDPWPVRFGVLAMLLFFWRDLADSLAASPIWVLLIRRFI